MTDDTLYYTLFGMLVLMLIGMLALMLVVLEPVAGDLGEVFGGLLLFLALSYGIGRFLNQGN